MAPTSTALTTKVASGSPYQLDKSQVTRAANALVQHIQKDVEQKEAQASRKSLLADASNDSDEEIGNGDDVPVWLVLTTKKHIVDKKRLKPGKIAVPHTLYKNPDVKICLITADPQRTYKDIVAHPSFPKELSERIGRVIGLEKLKAKYKSFESRRQLAGEYDVFLADERIITFLPKVLGKIFYKGTAKRPIPVRLTGNEKAPKDDKGKKQKEKLEGSKGSSIAGKPADVANTIQKTFDTCPIHPSPSATTQIRVAFASFTPDQIVDNVTAVVNGLTEKFIPQGWRNIRSIHIKGPQTAALPVWLASELWLDEQDVLDEKHVPQPKQPREKKEKKGTKRSADEAVEGAEESKAVEGAPKKKAKKDAKEGAADLSKEIAQRKEKLKRQKEEALEAIHRPAKKAKKSVAVA